MLKFRCAPQTSLRSSGVFLRMSLSHTDLAVYCGYERKQVSNIQTDIQRKTVLLQKRSTPIGEPEEDSPKSYRLVKSVENIYHKPTC